MHDKLATDLKRQVLAGLLTARQAVERMAYELFLRRKSLVTPDYRTLYASADRDWSKAEALLA